MYPRKVLIVGGSGFVGSAVASQLAAARDQAAAQLQAKEATLDGWVHNIAIDKTLKRQWLAGVRLERQQNGRVRLLTGSLMQRDYLRNQLFQQLCAGLRVQDLEVEVCQ